MAWMLTALTEADRDLILTTLRKEAERREQAASRSALELVVGTADGRIGKARADAVRRFHEDAETLRSLAWDMEHQREVPAVVEAAEVVEEERAATYPPLREVPDATEILEIADHLAKTPTQPADPVRRTPSGKTRTRGVKIVQFDEDSLAASMAAHPSDGTTQPQED